MKRNWVYDETIKRGLAYARKNDLDLGTEVMLVRLADIQSEPSVIPDQGMIDAIKQAAQQGLSWPKEMPLATLACTGPYCFALDGNHRIKAAHIVGLDEIPVVVTSYTAWEALLPVIEQEDIIPYEDFIAILAEAGSEDIRTNLRLETEAGEKFG